MVKVVLRCINACLLC